MVGEENSKIPDVSLVWGLETRFEQLRSCHGAWSGVGEEHRHQQWGAAAANRTTDLVDTFRLKGSVVSLLVLDWPVGFLTPYFQTGQEPSFADV